MLAGWLLLIICFTVLVCQSYSKFFLNEDTEKNACNDDILDNLINQVYGEYRQEELNREQLRTALMTTQDACKRSLSPHCLKPLKKSDMHLPSSCAEASAEDDKDRIYKLHIPGYDIRPFLAYCKVGNEPAWTVIQQRVDGAVDFFLEWDEYKRGFGNLLADHWIGLEKLHALTNYENQELWIHYRAQGAQVREARFKYFIVANEKSGYMLSTLGELRGNLSDAIRYQVGEKFATRDRDCPNFNCAKKYKSGWWYNCRDKCLGTNLNGPWDRKAADKIGIDWDKDDELDDRVALVFMAIRPVDVKSWVWDWN